MAECIAAHAVAQHQLDRVWQAQQREEDRYFNELQPAHAKAKKALAAARATEPRDLVDQILGDEALPDDGVEVEQRLEAAQRELDSAERKLTASREVRKLLADEEVRARASVSIATPALNEAANAVIRAETSALISRFVECRQRFAESAAAILSLPDAVRPPGVAGWHTVDDVNIRVTGNKPDTAVATWLATLRENPDAVLPELPPPEPPEDGQRAA